MYLKSASKLLRAALILGAIFAVAAAAASAASAEDAAAPPDAQQPPASAAATATPSNCIDETGDYVTHGKLVTYVIGLQNKCDKRLKCTIFANVTGVKGSTLGHTTLTLGAKSSGAAAKNSYVMKVKAFGGTAQVSRECQEF